jgi:hypothetical protein
MIDVEFWRHIFWGGRHTFWGKRMGGKKMEGEEMNNDVDTDDGYMISMDIGWLFKIRLYI